MTQRRRDNIVGGWVPRDGSKTPYPDVVNRDPEPAVGKWKKTHRGKRAGKKARTRRLKSGGRGGRVMKESGGENTTAPRLESPAGSGFGFKYGQGRDYEAFEDTEEFFGEEEEVELNPQAEDFTPGCSSKWFRPSWRKDEPGDEGGGGLGAAGWVS
jgi:hypothetical protein